MSDDMEKLEITAELNLKKIIDESREVAQALNELLILLNRLKRSMQSHRKGANNENR